MKKSEIDTDKYEGHTQGHWGITTRKGTWVVHAQDNGDVATMNDYEDAQLIADAPLLLEEVKRLREALVGDSKDWTTDELVEKIFTLYDKAHAWDKMVEYYSENEGTEYDSQAYYEMREEMERVLEEVKK